jgi:peptide/nickel transport system permease protein
MLIVTVFLVSVAVFAITESTPGNIAKNVLGAFITPEQEASFLTQMGLDKPAYLRYIFWLVGSDWYASQKSGFEFKRVTNSQGFDEWWAVDEQGRLVRWTLEAENLVALVRQPDGSVLKETDNSRWRTDSNGISFFWGMDLQNRVVKWQKGADNETWTFLEGMGWQKASGAPVAYIPMRKGILRLDPGISLRTGRPVGPTLMVRLRNSMVLAGLAIAIIMPIALFLGIISGINEGTWPDRILSTSGMIFTVIPEFVTGIILILLLTVIFPIFPGATIFGEEAPWDRPDMLVLPVLTLTLIELGYILRITRASMAETIQAPYIRTAFLKGLPYWKVVIVHSLRNALIAPVTVIMLHVTWLLGGIVIVEVVFGYPGLGKYTLDAALYKDVNVLEACSMILVVVAVGSQLVADIVYTFLNPRIRYN